MANIKIIDLSTGSPESTSYIEATQVDSQAASGRSSVKVNMAELGNWIAGQGNSPLEYNDLKTEDDTPIGAINELHDSIGADVFNPNTSYTAGMYCINNNTLYRCKTPTSGAWDSTKWEAKTIIDSINEVKTIAEGFVEANPNENATAELTKLKVGSTVYDFGEKIVYGFHVDSTESDPDDCVTYLEDSIGFNPSYMDFTNDRFVWGSWRNAFFMPRPCMLNSDGTVAYYLDENDYSLKEDGTASDVDDDTFDGNAMMEWGRDGQKIWYKIVPDSGDSTSYSVYIANYKADSSYQAWSFYDSENILKEHFYTPIYNGSIDTNGKLRSISGKTYSDLCQNKTAAQEITAAELNNIGTDKGWYTEVFADITLINFLLILMSKSLATQEKFGYGRINQASAVSSMIGSGTMNNKGLFWGSNGNNDGVKVFGMENYWANQWRRYAGHWLINNVNYYKMTLCWALAD